MVNLCVNVIVLLGVWRIMNVTCRILNIALTTGMF